MLQSPLGLTREKVWKQLQKRSEFSDYKTDPTLLSQHDAIVVEKMTEMFMHEEVVSSAPPQTTEDSVHRPNKSMDLQPNSDQKQTTSKTKVENNESNKSNVEEKDPPVAKPGDKSTHPKTNKEKQNLSLDIDKVSEDTEINKAEKLKTKQENDLKDTPNTATSHASSDTSLKKASVSSAEDPASKKSSKEHPSKSKGKDRSQKE